MFFTVEKPRYSDAGLPAEAPCRRASAYAGPQRPHDVCGRNVDRRYRTLDAASAQVARKRGRVSVPPFQVTIDQSRPSRATENRLATIPFNIKSNTLTNGNEHGQTVMTFSKF
jgi:hypothetical protein